MTREEAIHELQEDKRLYETEVCHAGDGSPDGRLLEALDMAIEALQTDLVLCKDCKKRGAFGEKGFCELYARGVPDKHYCSYGERREG